MIALASSRILELAAVAEGLPTTHPVAESWTWSSRINFPEIRFTHWAKKSSVLRGKSSDGLFRQENETQRGINRFS
jgi:hypothetical protein